MTIVLMLVLTFMTMNEIMTRGLMESRMLAIILLIYESTMFHITSGLQ